MNRTRAALLLALALPVGIAEAQQPPAGPPANPIVTSFRNRTTNLRRNLAQAFDSIPATLFGYKPTPAQLSVGYVAQHLASDNYFYCNNFSDKKATVPAQDTSTPDSVKATWPKDSLVAKLKASIAFCDEVMGPMDDSKVTELVTVAGANGQTRQVPRINFLVGHAIDL
ncbi:MAG TPA: DinB family protein, partial [Gemmatimonadales bacterium]|nr:DinB family protein [Gemmatimonadales bacterium]